MSRLSQRLLAVGRISISRQEYEAMQRAIIIALTLKLSPKTIQRLEGKVGR